MKKLLYFLLAFGIGITGAFLLVQNENGKPFNPFPAPTIIQQESKAIIPTRIEIPSIGVVAKVESVGLDSMTNAMANPQDARDTAWYALGYKPGEKGSSVISGHYDRRDGSGAVFFKLNRLKTGDFVFVYDDKHQLRYEVVKVEEYPVSSFPLEKVFNTKGTALLNLITCSGVWNAKSQNYSKRTVVYTKLSD